MVEKIDVFYRAETIDSAINFIAGAFGIPPPAVKSIFVDGAFFVGETSYAQLCDLEEPYDGLFESEVMFFPLGEDVSAIIDIANRIIFKNKLKIKFYA